MVNRLLLITIILSATTGTACAVDQCTQGSEFEPPLCPLVLPTISKITITENAAKSPLEKDNSVTCSDFTINEAQVRRYFSMTKETNENDMHHTLDWSPCYASGKIVFSDGRIGDWNLNQYRTGSLVVDNGKKRVLYCPRCNFKPFQW